MADTPAPMSFDDACEAVCGPGTLFEVGDGEIDGIVSRVFVHAPPNIAALYGLAAAREDEFLVYEDERWTMQDMLAKAGQIGHLLVDRYQMAKGDRVALAMRNYPEWIAAFIAITSVGGVAVPLNAWWQTDELEFAVGDSGSKLILADEERLGRLMAAGEGSSIRSAKIVAVRASGDLPDGVDSLEASLADSEVSSATMPAIEVGPDDDVTILYTSGTTGNPKGAVSTHRALVHALMCFGARAQVGALTEPAEDPEAAEAETPVIMLAVPLFHVTGLVPVMLGSILSGGKLVMTHRWDPDRALELLEREAVTNFVGVPTMAWDLLEAPTWGQHDLSSLRSVGGGGAPMPPELVKRIDENFPKGRPGLGYGMTETNAYGPQNSGRDFLAKPTSTGRTIPIMEMRITDPDGNVLPNGETGELWFKGPSLIKGYWNRPDATAETLVDGWLRSGDIGTIDDEGFVYVSDRAKDMVLRAGENIYCIEVEAAIYEHPAVYEAAVYGVPDERLGEDLACHIMVREGHTLDPSELQTFLGQRLAKFKVPSRVTLVSESLPRNASGKILKRQLRDELSAEG